MNLFARRFKLVILALLATAVASAQTTPPSTAPAPTSSASPPASTLRVAVVDSAPFVVAKDGVYSGISIDIWTRIAAANKWAYAYTLYPNVKAAIEAVSGGKEDVIVTDASITKPRLELVEFSQPFFRSGLQVMITDARPHTLSRFLEDLRTYGHYRVIWVLVLVVSLVSLGVAWFESKHNPDFPKKKGHAVVEGFYLVVTTMLGKSVYKGFGGPIGRISAMVWMIMGMVGVAVITSMITSMLTVEKLRSRISGPQDLPSHTIGILEGTTAVDYAGQHRLDTQQYATLADAVTDLVAGKIDAIVGDAPMLEYYDKNHPELPITEVGPVFEPQNYGFAVVIGSPYRQQLNEQLVALQEAGIITDLSRQYLGTLYQP